MRASIQSECSERAFRASVRSERSERALLLRLPPTFPAHHLRKTVSRFALACETQASTGWAGWVPVAHTFDEQDEWPPRAARVRGRSLMAIAPARGRLGRPAGLLQLGLASARPQSRQRSGEGGRAGQHGQGRGRHGAWARRGAATSARSAAGAAARFMRTALFDLAGSAPNARSRHLASLQSR